MLTDPVLVLVDMQKDFCRPGYACLDDPIPGIETAVKNASNFLDRYRATGRNAVFVRTHHDETSTSPAWHEKYGDSPIPCRPDTEGSELVDELGVEPNDELVTKHRYSGFHDTRLEVLLSSNEVTRLLVGGVNTEICVASTVFDAFNRDYHVTTLADCCGTSEPARHETVLDLFDESLGGTAESSDVAIEDAR
jgi:nicotinamidase-related amidase